ncbi:MAG: sensor histidine kinase [Chitinophagaceae bacterium]
MISEKPGNSFVRHKPFVVHFFYWLSYVAINHVIRIAELSGFYYKTAYIDTLTKYGLGIGMFYITSYFIYPRFLKNWGKLSFLLVLLMLVHSVIRFIFYNQLFLLYDHDYKYIYTYWQAFPSAFWYFYQYALFGLAFFIYRRSKASSRALLAEQQKIHRLETQNLSLEYKFLRAQINPHFLYNVLGFFYTKVKRQDAKAGRAMLLVTEMMRYSIREPDADDKVAIGEEFQAITNLLELQRLRFEDSVYAAIDIQADIDHLRIVPHILVTLVENACKHGDLTVATEPLKITAGIVDGWFEFTVLNNIRSSKLTEPDTGFGLVNLANRLVLQYSDHQQFTFGRDGANFSVLFRLKTDVMIAIMPDAITRVRTFESNKTVMDFR